VLRETIAKILQGFATVWLYLVTVVVVIAVTADFWLYGFFETLKLVSPLNLKNYLVVMVMVAPAAGAQMLGKKLTQRSSTDAVAGAKTAPQKRPGL
jgi:hypothetical protein